MGESVQRAVLFRPAWRDEDRVGAQVRKDSDPVGAILEVLLKSAGKEPRSIFLKYFGIIWPSKATLVLCSMFSLS